VQLEAIAAYKLESMGYKLEENQATSCCELYRLYFREQWAGDEQLRIKSAVVSKSMLLAMRTAG